MRDAKDRAYDRARKGARGLPVPDLNVSSAYDLARLLMSGVPPQVALRYLDSEYAATLDLIDDEFKQEKKWAQWQRRFLNSPLLLTETTKLNGAEWQDLDPDRRLQIAFDKHLAELAYLLYAHNYASTDAPIAKMNSAREALQQHLEGGSEQPDSTWMAFLKDMMAGKVDAMETVLPSVPSDAGSKVKGN